MLKLCESALDQHEAAHKRLPKNAALIAISKPTVIASVNRKDKIARLEQAVPAFNRIWPALDFVTKHVFPVVT
jgi:hypothetical protein